MSPTQTTARWLAVVRCAWGATCLASPERVVVAAGGAPDVRALWFARALGARELAQGLVTLAAPGWRVRTAGVAVDGLHAVSVLGLAAVDASRRRPALLNALAATGWALLGLLPFTRGLPPRHPWRGRSGEDADDHSSTQPPPDVSADPRPPDPPGTPTRQEQQ